VQQSKYRDHYLSSCVAVCTARRPHTSTSYLLIFREKMRYSCSLSIYTIIRYNCEVPFNLVAMDKKNPFYNFQRRVPNLMRSPFSFNNRTLVKKLPLIRYKEIPGHFALIKITYELQCDTHRKPPTCRKSLTNFIT
jgi:hypothetical protein